MAKGLNEIKILGHVGNEPVVRTLESGVKCTTFSVATSKSFKNAQGEKKEVTQWHNVVIWRKLAEIAEKYVNKGAKIYISGEMTYRQYEKDGTTRYISEIVADDLILLSSNPGANQGGEESQPPPTQSNQQDHDDLPF